MTASRAFEHSPAERARAVALVVIVHLLVGAALLSGLAVSSVQRASKRLVSFDVTEVPPPAVSTPPPAPVAAPAAAVVPAPAGARTHANPVLAPRTAVSLPTQQATTLADQFASLDGSDTGTGAAEAGQGAGARSAGDGSGIGGAGGVPVTAARLLSGNLDRRDYRTIRALGSPRGDAVLAIVVGADGSISDCRAAQSSGNPELDERLCALLGRTRWAPALDAASRPVPVSLRYVANWDRN